MYLLYIGNQPGKRVDRIDTNDIRIDHDKDDIHVHNEDDTCDIAQKNNDGSAGINEFNV